MAQIIDENHHNLDFISQCIHAGVTPDPTTGALLTPIYQTTTYVQEAVGKDKGYTYTRTGNPTVRSLEKKLAQLESASDAICFSTGMAAITALCLAVLEQGDHVICSDVVYGGTVRLLQQVLAKYGITTTFTDTSNNNSVAKAVTAKTRLLFIETPANPTLKLSDIAAIAEIAKSKNILLAVDNTFLTATLQRPFDLGADIVVYSTTKYIDGHNATIGGALLANNQELIEKFQFIRNSVGSTQLPFQAWLTLQGIKTLPLRLQQHSTNALKIAEFLNNHPQVKQVFYPGLTHFPQYELAKRQHVAHGGMLAFEINGDLEIGIKFINSVRLCALAENLGAIESLITHPASMTHKPIPAAQRQAIGISDSLIRLSVGLENSKDIVNDLEQAFDKVRTAL